MNLVNLCVYFSVAYVFCFLWLSIATKCLVVGTVGTFLTSQISLLLLSFLEAKVVFSVLSAFNNCYLFLKCSSLLSLNKHLFWIIHRKYAVPLIVGDLSSLLYYLRDRTSNLLLIPTGLISAVTLKSIMSLRRKLQLSITL